MLQSMGWKRVGHDLAAEHQKKVVGAVGRATVNTGGIQSSKYGGFSLAEICSLSVAELLPGRQSFFFPFVS